MVNEYACRSCMITNTKTSLHYVDQNDLIKYAPHASPEFNAMMTEMSCGRVVVRHRGGDAGGGKSGGREGGGRYGGEVPAGGR